MVGMNRRTFLSGVVGTAFAGCLTPPTRAGASPDHPDRIDSNWRLPGYDHRLRNYTPEASGPTTEIDELWRVEGDTSYSPPVIADGCVFVGADDGTVQALDARDGDERWTVSVGETASQPQVGSEYVYVVTGEDTVALSPEDGSLVWRIDITPEISQSLRNRQETASSGGLLYTPHGLYLVRESEAACPDDADEDTCPAGAGEGPTTAALVSHHDPETGELLWEEPIYNPLSTHLFASAESLFVSSETVGTTPWVLRPDEGRVTEQVPGISHGPAEHCYSDGVVYGVDDWNGSFWPMQVTEDGVEPITSESVPFTGENLATDGKRCYISSSSEPGPPGVVCLSTDGTELWRHELDTVVGMPTIAEDIVLYRDSDTLYGVDPADGTERWTHSAADMGSEIAIVDDILYTVDGGTVLSYRSV